MCQVMSNLLRQVPEMDFNQKNVAESWKRWKEVMQLVFEGPDADMGRSWCSRGKMSADD